MGITSLFAKKTKNIERLKKDKFFTKELLLDIIDSSNCMVIFYTQEDGWIGANELFLNTFGFHDIADVGAKYANIQDMFIREEKDGITLENQTWLDSLSTDTQSSSVFRVYDANDKILTVEARVQTIESEKLFYILELQNITKLQEAQQRTQDVEKLKARFLANIGHEFRTPMNGLLGFVELLGQTDLDTRQMQYLQMISRSSLNLMSNIDTILDYSQMQGGKLTLNNSSFFILQELEQLAHTLYVHAKGKKINALTFIDPRIPQELIGDAKKVKQILNSLVQNAIKFTQRGGKIIVEVKLAKKVKDGECNIIFSVKDNGTGISNEHLTCSRDPLSPLNHADERAGVGLSLSYGLIDLLGSELELQTEKGHGTYFRYMLNFKVEENSTPLPKINGRVKVLLLDKSMINEANLLSLYLHSFGMNVVKTDVIDKNIYNGTDALYVVGKPYNSSWALDIGNFIKKVPIILLVDENEKLQSKLDYIVDDVIQRPLLPNHLYKHLQKVFNDKGDEKLHTGPKAHNTFNALVVEDNIINQKLLQILLQKYNILVSTAMDGNEAVEKCEKNSYDIVFMDIDMPNKNGIVATKEIKAMMGVNKETPFVALTAMVMDGDKEMLIREGLDDYISKPITIEKLESMLNKYLNVVYL